MIIRRSLRTAGLEQTFDFTHFFMRSISYLSEGKRLLTYPHFSIFKHVLMVEFNLLLIK